MNSTAVGVVERFTALANEERFRGWPMVGEPRLGPKIDYFGQVLNYELRTPRGIEQYTSILRHFGWSMVFGVTTDNQVITLVQWKPGVNRASWEMPPGGIGKVHPETTSEEILAKTRTVYLNETGFGDGEWSYLGAADVETGKYRGAGPDDHGLPAHMYLATGLVQKADARKPLENEIMETLMVPLNEFWNVIDSGLFREISAVACATLALRRLGVKG